MNPDEVVEQLVDDGLLTERQATAYVLREIELTPRKAVAEHMGISVNTLDNTLRRAKDKVEAAEMTIETIEHADASTARHRSAERSVKK